MKKSKKELQEDMKRNREAVDRFEKLFRIDSLVESLDETMQKAQALLIQIRKETARESVRIEYETKEKN